MLGVCRSCRRGLTSLCDNFNELGTMEPGGFAEFAAVPKHLVHPAFGLETDEAAMVEPAGNGCQAAEKAYIQPGDRVAVIGPGPIGLLAMQFAALYHPSVLISLGTRDNRLECAKKLGATHTVNVKETDAAEEVMQITSGLGVDQVINCATTDASFELATKIAGKNSTIVMEGLSGTGNTVPIRMDDFVTGPTAIAGASGVHTRQYDVVIDMIRAGRIDVKTLATHRFPLEEIETALDYMRNRRDEVIKIILRP